MCVVARRPTTRAGKLLMLLMDSVNPRVQQRVGYSLCQPVRTVHALLSRYSGALDLLSDPHARQATQCCTPNNYDRG